MASLQPCSQHVFFVIYTGDKSRSPPPSHNRSRDIHSSRATPSTDTRGNRQGEIHRSGDFDERPQSTRKGASPPPPRRDSYDPNGVTTLRRAREADLDRDYPENDSKRQRTGQYTDPGYVRKPARRDLSPTPPPRPLAAERMHVDDDHSRMSDSIVWVC